MPFSVLESKKSKPWPERWPGLAYGIGIGIVIAAVAAAVRWLLDPYLGNSYPFIMCFFAVIGASLWRGTAAGLAATATSVLLADYLWTAPRGSLAIADVNDIVAFALFATIGIVISLLGGERLRALNQLKEKVEEARTLVDILPVGVVVADPEGRNIVGNKALYDMFRLPYGTNFSLTADRVELPAGTRVLHGGKELGPDSYPMQWTGRTGRALVDFDQEFVFPDGRRMTILSNTAPLFDSAGKLRGVVGISMDISDRKRAEDSKRESERNFRLMGDNAPVLIWMSGTDKLCTWFNRQWLEFVGRPMEKEIGNGWAENVHPDDFERCLKIYVEAFDARESFSMEYRLKRHDGVYRWLLDRGAPIYGADGKFTGYIGSCIDVTEHHEAEESLRESEQRLRIALEAGRMGTWEWQMQAGKVTWSPGLEAIHGLEPGTFDGTFEAYQKDIHPEDRDRVLGTIAETAARGEKHLIEYRIVLPNGDVRWVEGRGDISRSEGGKPAAMIGVCIDITERKLTENRLRLFAQELQHRGRNMLAMIKAMISMTAADNVADYAKILSERIDAVGRTYSLLSANQYRSADLKKLLDQAILPYLPEPDGRIDIRGPVMALGIRGSESMGMVIHELTTNAVKYGALSRPEGRLAVEWTQPNNGRLTIDWKEAGVPLSETPQRIGFGRKLMTTIVEKQLQGQMAFDWRDDGLHCRMELPEQSIVVGAVAFGFDDGAP